MGRRIEEAEAETCFSSSSSSSSFDALLYATMCLIGLPVEVQVKDGSVYTGIFHTASVEGQYGVVLKMAYMSRRGERNTNFTFGSVIDTLVVLPGDLVQVIAKGFLNPADGIVDNVNTEAAKLFTVSNRPSSYRKVEKECQILKSVKTRCQSSEEENTERIGHGSLEQWEESWSLQGSASASAEFIDSLSNGGFEHGMQVVPNPIESMVETETENVDAEIERAEEASSGQLDTNISYGRQDEECSPPQQQDGHCTGNADSIVNEVHSSSMASLYVPEQNCFDETATEMPTSILPNKTPSNGPVPPVAMSEAPDSSLVPSDAPSSHMSTSSTPTGELSNTCLSSMTSQTVSVLPKKPVSNSNNKEFRLNPKAKTFSPAFANLVSLNSTQTALSSMSYGANNSSVAPILNARPGIEINHFTPLTSVPVKLIPYSNFVAGNTVGGNHYSSATSLPMSGHIGGREQAVRYNTQYQAGSAYVQPNSQTVMVGRLGQVVYVHPFSHDTMQGAASISQGTVRPAFTPHAVHIPKNQGAVTQTSQLCMTSQYIPGGEQSFAVPTHMPFPQSFPVMRPISVPGMSSVYGGKFA